MCFECLKVITHELCHVFGLSHCVYFECSMNGSSSLAEALAQPMFLCPVCLRKLQKCIKFDLKERYEALHSFFVDLNQQFDSDYFRNAEQWLEKCLRMFHDDQPTTRDVTTTL